jgi:hypothetical protein
VVRANADDKHAVSKLRCAEIGSVEKPMRDVVLQRGLRLGMLKAL